MNWATLANLAVPLIAGVALGVSIEAVRLARRVRQEVSLGRPARCPVYPDGQHRNTRSLIPASYSHCECGATSEYNPDRFA